MAKVLLSNLYTVAKGENETCGGIYGLVGSCATGLSCVDPPKGQLISKCLFEVLNFRKKKTMKDFDEFPLKNQKSGQIIN